MPNYLKSVIYKLYCICKTKIVLDFYIGSTTIEKRREQAHKNNCNNKNSNNYNLQVYEFIRENGGWDKWKFEIIERCPCENLKQLKEKLSYYYDLLKPKLKMEPNYSDSVIYKLICKTVTVLEFYIGSTANEKRRVIDHKSVCNNESSNGYNYPVYKFIRANGGWNNWIFEIIERYPCDNDEQLRIKERYYYDLLKPILNIDRPLRTTEELKQEIVIYNEEHREEHAKYYKNNKVKISKRSTMTYEKNKDKICKRSNQTNECECGKKYTFGNKIRHCKSQKHIKFIEQHKTKE